jgi:hypothetical protein
VPESAAGPAPLAVAQAAGADSDAAAEVEPIRQPATPARGVAEPATSPSHEAAALSAGGTRRLARYGLSVQFEPRPDDPERARLVETTVWINEAHPAYRAHWRRGLRVTHIALGTAMALAPLAVEPAKEHAFLTTFLATWGALERCGARRRK